MWNRIRVAALGALVLATGACATVQPQEPLTEALAIIAASALVSPEQTAAVAREAIEARRAEPARITAVAVLCAPSHEAEITSAALKAAPDDAAAIRRAARWAVWNRTTVAMSVLSADDVARLVDRAIR